MSFDARVYFVQYFPATLIAIFTVGTLYILWDVVAIRRGHWEFNEQFVGSAKLLKLPIGEWLFFLCIPYSCIFILEVVAEYFGMGFANSNLVWLQYLLGGASFLAAFWQRRRGYTFLSLLSTGVFFLASAILTPGILFASGYMITFACVFVVFLIVDGLFTHLPTIRYNENKIVGVRVGTIPMEDFFYNLSYIGLVFTVYLSTKTSLPEVF